MMVLVFLAQTVAAVDGCVENDMHWLEFRINVYIKQTSCDRMYNHMKNREDINNFFCDCEKQQESAWKNIEKRDLWDSIRQNVHDKFSQDDCCKIWMDNCGNYSF